MTPTIEQVIRFLEDEGLSSSLKIRNGDKENWSLNFNEPWEQDGKRRCGIAQLRDKKSGKLFVGFNSFKAVANMGDEYKGSFWKFVKLVKNFASTQEAKYWFLHKYVTLSDATSSFSEDIPEPSRKILRINEIDLPDWFVRYRGQHEFKKYTQYLLDRNVDLKNIKKLKLFIDTQQKRIIFPVYEFGILVFYTGRSLDPKNTVPWLKSAGEGVFPIWNLENVNGDTINIFEGIFDALMVPNSVAILGATYVGEPIVKKILYKNYLRINVILDNDTPGYNAKRKLALELSREHNNVWIYNFNGITQKDFNLMKQENVDFDFDNRLHKWGLATELLMKMGSVI